MCPLFIMMAFTGTVSAQTTDCETGLSIDILMTASCQETTTNDTPKGVRLPSRKVECHISSDGLVEVSSIDVKEILTFEIYDGTGICIGSFGDSLSFTETLFSLSGVFEIRFVTQENILRGYVEI